MTVPLVGVEIATVAEVDSMIILTMEMGDIMIAVVHQVELAVGITMIEGPAAEGGTDLTNNSSAHPVEAGGHLKIMAEVNHVPETTTTTGVNHALIELLT